MVITTLSSREFDRSTDAARQAANQGPVFITDKGQPTHVLMTYERYQGLVGNRQTIADLLALPGAAKAGLEITRSREPARSPDFS